MISISTEYELPYYHDASQVTLDMVMDNDYLTHVLWSRYFILYRGCFSLHCIDHFSS